MSAVNLVPVNLDEFDGTISSVTASVPNYNVAQALVEPDLFVEYFLQTDLWEVPKQILHALKKPSSQVAVKSCHASGKSHLTARALLWFLARFQNCTVVTTAPTWNQVEKVIWGEVHSALSKSRYPFPKPLQTELKINSKRLAYGFSTSVTNQDEGVRFQGIHNENVLVIMDEAPGVDPKIWQAIEGARAGGNVRVLAIGNPTISSGPFHDCFTKNRFAWDCITINAFGTPNFRDIPGHDDLVTEDNKVVEGSKLWNLLKLGKENPDFLNQNVRPYLTRREWVFEKFHTWGLGHPLWESRVMGNFPKQDEFALLSLGWLEAASRNERKGTGRISFGLDVAGPGEAETSLTGRRGCEIIVHKQWPISDPRGEIVNILNQYRGEIDTINVDAVGIGWYIYKHLQDLGFPATPVIAQSASGDSEKYHTTKDEFYWGFRLRCQSGDLSGLTDETTIGQLAGIRYKHNSRGQVEVESKEDAAKRGIPSPDRAESVMLAFAKRLMCFGVLDVQKEEKTEFEKSRAEALSKASRSNDPTCEKCGSKALSISNNNFHCNVCGTDKQIKPVQPQRITRKNIFSGADAYNQF